MDIIKRAILLDGKAIITIIDSTELVNDARMTHNLDDSATQMLGKVLMIGSFMTAGLKGFGNGITLIVDSNGAAGKIVVVADCDLKVRGYIQNPKLIKTFKQDSELQEFALGSEGIYRVIKEFRQSKNYSGGCEMKYSNIEKDFENYFTTSEQLPTKIFQDIKIEKGECKSAVGVYIQAMPNCSFDALQEIANVTPDISEISKLFSKNKHKEVLSAYDNLKPYFLEDKVATFVCSCSKERVEEMIKGLGLNEANSIVKDEGKIEVKCQFCNKNYIYEQKDVDKIFANKSTKQDVKDTDKSNQEDPKSERQDDIASDASEDRVLI